MENLQLQDAFTPYYAGRQAEQPAGHAKAAHSNLVSMAEVRARLEACRNVLARAVAADAKSR